MINYFEEFSDLFCAGWRVFRCFGGLTGFLGLGEEGIPQGWRPWEAQG
jgi:hypothetical protein